MENGRFKLYSKTYKNGSYVHIVDKQMDKYISIPLSVYKEASNNILASEKPAEVSAHIFFRVFVIMMLSSRVHVVLFVLYSSTF